MVEPESYELITIIKRLAALLHQNIDLLLKPYDLARTQYVILRHLSEQGSLATSELLAKMQIEPATLSGLIDTLEAKDLVQRVKHPEDKRCKDVRLTDTGRRLLRDIPPPGPFVQQLLLGGVDPERADEFRHMGWRMIENLEIELQKKGGTEGARKTEA